MTAKRTLVGPCGRLVNFHDRLACLDLRPTRLRTIQILSFDLGPRIPAHVVIPTVRGDEHGDGRTAIGFDFVVVLCSRLIEACDHQEIGSFEKRGKQAGGPERIGHVQNRLRVQLTQQGLDFGDDMGGAGFEMELA